MSLYLGVDAGGSKTHAVICDEQGNILGKGASGNGNHQIHREHAARNIEEACNRALQEAGAAKEDISYAYFGLAGADREADYEILRPMIGALGYPRHAIACDTIIGMRAGTSRPYGAALICGTGFNSAARNRAGKSCSMAASVSCTGMDMRADRGLQPWPSGRLFGPGMSGDRQPC